jgi:tRNA 5-methylaminomethyl-2-thiouridine biosynthesis bifunctional protein
MRGALTWALHSSVSPADQSPAFPAFPVNGSGSLIPNIPMPQGSAWFMGSTYQDTIEPERSAEQNQAINLAHLQDLLPTLADQLAPCFGPDRSELWKGVRCVSVDRLPVVGPLQVDGHSGLWLCAAMGSRGLSFSVLCAELLAARMGHEPLPVESRLAQALDVMRGK